MIIPPDVEQWLCNHLRTQITDIPRLQIGNREPPDYDGTHPLIVIRDIPGPRTAIIAYDWAIGVTIRGWARDNPKPCKDLARRVLAILTDDPAIITAPNSPIAAINHTSGPTPPAGDTSPAARYYLTVDYTIAGEIQQPQP
ncbi:hypothetical protein [Bifidobacterium sp. UTCIF-39]|uniref:hypothetical protein n=1 Tax=Bifidobacterium sp. UTCIF-39 TaxID=1465359 RepID=UPI00112DDA32|nr:hypothetical protein [Bifidobacterium sp. UTCIF-39]